MRRASCVLAAVFNAAHARPPRPARLHDCLCLKLCLLLLVSLWPRACGAADSTTAEDAELSALLRDAAGHRFGLPLAHSFDHRQFYRPSSASSTSSYQSASFFPSSFASSSFSFSAPSPSTSPPPRPPSPSYPQSISAAIRLYSAAAERGSSAALVALAEIALFGEGGSRVNVPHAVSLLMAAAELGDSRAQHYLSVLYATGIGLPQSAALSVLYSYFAALAGDPLALMSLGYRHLHGDGVPVSCNAAVAFYSKVAAQVAREVESEPVSQILEKLRLQAEGEGAGTGGDSGRSVVSDGVDEDVVLYHRHAAEHGDTSAQLALANVLLYGTHGLQADYHSAAHYFAAAAGAGDMQARTQLAYMMQHGIGLQRDHHAAFQLLTAIIASGLPHPAAAYNLMGRAYESGWGVERDEEAALAFYLQAADKQHADGEYNAGRMLYAGRGGEGAQQERATELWIRCAEAGHTLCIHRLAGLHQQGLDGVASCDLAVSLFKIVSERGRWSNSFMSAFRRWMAGDAEAALLLYTRLAAEGHEIAQSNAAFLLQHQHGYSAVRRANASLASDSHRLTLAHSLLRHSALQGHAVSRRVLGDFAYYGLPPHSSPDYVTAFHHYSIAAEQGNAHAAFNLGWLHEWLERDWDAALARYADSAGSTGQAVGVVWAARVRLYCHRLITRLGWLDGQGELRHWLQQHKDREWMESWLGADSLYSCLLLVLCAAVLWLMRRR